MINELDMLNIFTPNPNENIGVTSLPTTQEVRDKNFQKMETALIDAGYRKTWRVVECSDGEEYEIIEIRGPKASGFFILKTIVSSTASDFLYTSAKHKHLLRKR